MERLIATEWSHFVLLDSALTAADGSGLMPRISKATDAPLVLLAGRGAIQERDRALAFESGADDYIAKPFARTELVARVGAVPRRHDPTGHGSHEGVFQVGHLAVDHTKRWVTVDARAVALTETECRLHCELAVNVGKTLSREHLMRRVWSTRGPTDSSLVRGYVRRLRQKLGESAANRGYIYNEPRVGYRLGEPDDQEEATP